MSTVQFEAASDGGPVLEPGTYILEPDNIEDAGPGKYGSQLKWSFKVSDPATPDEPIRGADGEPYLFFGWSGTKLTPLSRCRQLVEALYGRPLVTRERPTADRLIGRRMRALIVHVNDTDGKPRARISAEIAPRPFPRQGESTVEPVPEPDVPKAPPLDQDARRREILGDDVE